MFDDQQIQTYRNIKVPSELKARILDGCECREVRKIGGAFSQRRWLRSLATVAACFALAVAIFAVTRTEPQAVVSYGGTILSQEKIAVNDIPPSAEAGSRLVAPEGIPLAIRTSRLTEISVSDGSLYRISDDGEQVLSLGQNTDISEDAVIWWVIDPTASRCEFSLVEGRVRTVYVLEWDSSTSRGMMVME